MQNLHAKVVVVVVVDETLTETRARVVVDTGADPLHAVRNIATPPGTSARALRTRARVDALPGEARGGIIRDAVHGDGDALDEIADRTGQA